MDTLTPTARSARMAAVRRSGTAPELTVRRELHRLGYRFRLHRRDLPGTPDIVLPGKQSIVLVHGCFWHGHVGCKAATVPKTRTEYWTGKIQGNRHRDARVSRALRRLGWKVLVVWQCQTREKERLATRLNRFLSSTRNE